MLVYKLQCNIDRQHGRKDTRKSVVLAWRGCSGDTMQAIDEHLQNFLILVSANHAMSIFDWENMVAQRGVVVTEKLEMVRAQPSSSSSTISSPSIPVKSRSSCMVGTTKLISESESES